MPRKGVPYGGGICSLKERIAELEQRMASLVNTVNHITANGGDISIAANAPLNVTNDATAHKITVGVSKDNTPIEDSSALVTSGGVKAAINAEAQARAKAVSDEAAARQTADATLQGTVDGKAAKTEALGTDTMLSLASGTGARNLTLTRKTVSGAVSGQFVTLPIASPTESGLMTAAQAVRLDAADAEAVKLTGNQSISGIKTFSSNPKIAAPASGATDDSAVNANWVSQTGEGRPNNLIHMSGTERITGTKIFQSALHGNSIQLRTVDMDVTKPGSSDRYSNSILWVDENGIIICQLWVRQRSNGRIALGIDIKKSDNTWDFGHIIYEST